MSKTAFKKFERLKYFKGCLPLFLLGPFLNALSYIYSSTYVWTNFCYEKRFYVFIFQEAEKRNSKKKNIYIIYNKKSNYDFVSIPNVTGNSMSRLNFCNSAAGISYLMHFTFTWSPFSFELSCIRPIIINNSDNGAFFLPLFLCILQSLNISLFSLRSYYLYNSLHLSL